MTRVAIEEAEDGAAIRLSAQALADLGLRPGESVDLTIEDGRAVIAPVRPKPVTLEWILSEMRRLGPENEPETVDWGPDTPGERIDDDYSRSG